MSDEIMRWSTRGRAVRVLRVPVTVAAVLCIAACSSSRGSDGSTAKGPGCNLTAAEKQKAVTTFASLMPAFSHPRCANCHGGIDVYAASAKDDHGGGQMDRQKTVDSTNFKSGLGPVEVSMDEDNTQCEQCHDVVGWHQPTPAQNITFAGRSASTICRQIKHRMSPSALATHVAHDVLVHAGFDGRRGQRDLSPKPPPMTLVDFQTKINAWAALVRDRSRSDDWQGGMDSDCGCVPDGHGYRITDHERTVSAKQGLGEDITYSADLTVDSTGNDYVGTGTYYGTLVTQKLNCHNTLPIDRQVHPVHGTLEGTGNDVAFGSAKRLSYTLTPTDWPVALTIFAMGSGPNNAVSADDEATAHKMGGITQMLLKVTGPRTVLHDRTVSDGHAMGYMAGCSGDVTHTSDITIEEMQ